MESVMSCIFDVLSDPKSVVSWVVIQSNLAEWISPQKCIMSLTNVIGNLELVNLQNPKIYGINETQNEDGNSYEAQNDKLQFDILAEPLNSSFNSEFNTNYSKAQAKFYLKRKPRIISNLLSSYYAPTSVLAFLSLISFCIEPND